MEAWSSKWASDAAAGVAHELVKLAGLRPGAEPFYTDSDGKKQRTPTLAEELEQDSKDRARALLWVGELEGKGRADRIECCGYTELCFNPSSKHVGWRNRWCRDRACPGCAKRRAVGLKHQLRKHLEQREETRSAQYAPLCSLAALIPDADRPPGPMLFVTLTQPKRDQQEESPGMAVTRLLDQWRKLTNRRPFKREVQGFLRATEVTYSKRGFAGWHAHIHCVLELAPGCSKAAIEKYITSVWCGLVDGDASAQNFQNLDADKLGQVVKYITKPFALPVDLAPTFFDDMAGRKLISGSGTWRDYAKHEEAYIAAPGWVPQSTHIAELMDAACKGRRWSFRWLVDENGQTSGALPWKEAAPDELERVLSVLASDAWIALHSDPRPVVWRCSHPSEAAASVRLDPEEAAAAPLAPCPTAPLPAARASSAAAGVFVSSWTPD